MQQNRLNQKRQQWRTLQLLDYMASQDEAVIMYKASNMGMAAHNDALYLSEL